MYIIGKLLETLSPQNLFSFRYVDTSEVPTTPRFELQTIPGTRAYHNFKPLSEEVIVAFQLSGDTLYDTYNLETNYLR